MHYCRLKKRETFHSFDAFYSLSLLCDIVKNRIYFLIGVGSSVSSSYRSCKINLFFSMEMNIYTLNIKTTVTWHHDFYGCQGYKKK